MHLLIAIAMQVAAQAPLTPTDTPAPPAEAAAPSTPAAAETPAPAESPARPERVCRVERTTGTMITRRVCRDREDVEDVAERTGHRLRELAPPYVDPADTPR